MMPSKTEEKEMREREKQKYTAIIKRERERERTRSLISLWELIRVNEPGSVAVWLRGSCRVSSPVMDER